MLREKQSLQVELIREKSRLEIVSREARDDEAQVSGSSRRSGFQEWMYSMASEGSNSGAARSGEGLTEKIDRTQRRRPLGTPPNADIRAPPGLGEEDEYEEEAYYGDEPDVDVMEMVGIAPRHPHAAPVGRGGSRARLRTPPHLPGEDTPEDRPPRMLRLTTPYDEDELPTTGGSSSASRLRKAAHEAHEQVKMLRALVAAKKSNQAAAAAKVSAAQRKAQLAASEAESALAAVAAFARLKARGSARRSIGAAAEEKRLQEAAFAAVERQKAAEAELTSEEQRLADAIAAAEEAQARADAATAAERGREPGLGRRPSEAGPSEQPSEPRSNSPSAPRLRRRPSQEGQLEAMVERGRRPSRTPSLGKIPNNAYDAQRAFILAREQEELQQLDDSAIGNPAASGSRSRENQSAPQLRRLPGETIEAPTPPILRQARTVRLKSPPRLPEDEEFDEEVERRPSFIKLTPQDEGAAEAEDEGPAPHRSDYGWNGDPVGAPPRPGSSVGTSQVRKLPESRSGRIRLNEMSGGISAPHLRRLGSAPPQGHVDGATPAVVRRRGGSAPQLSPLEEDSLRAFEEEQAATGLDQMLVRQRAALVKTTQREDPEETGSTVDAPTPPHVRMYEPTLFRLSMPPILPGEEPQDESPPSHIRLTPRGSAENSDDEGSRPPLVSDYGWNGDPVGQPPRPGSAIGNSRLQSMNRQPPPQCAASSGTKLRLPGGGMNALEAHVQQRCANAAEDDFDVAHSPSATLRPQHGSPMIGRGGLDGVNGAKGVQDV